MDIEEIVHAIPPIYINERQNEFTALAELVSEAPEFPSMIGWDRPTWMRIEFLAIFADSMGFFGSVDPGED